MGVGTDVTIAEMATLVAETVGYKGRIEWDTEKTGRHLPKLGVDRINGMGWKAETTLSDGIRRTYEWFLQHRSDYHHETSRMNRRKGSIANPAVRVDRLMDTSHRPARSPRNQPAVWRFPARGPVASSPTAPPLSMRPRSTHRPQRDEDSGRRNGRAPASRVQVGEGELRKSRTVCPMPVAST